MHEQRSNTKIVTRLLFRLLPVQILLCAVGAVNGIVSSFFATNFVGIDAMSAVGVYGPVGMLATSIGTILTGGSAILCGKYMGQNEREKMQSVFSLTLLLSLFVAVVFIAAYVPMGLFDLTGFLSKDVSVRAYLNKYLLGQAIGMVPLLLGNTFAAFLSIENKGKRTFTASVIYIAVNILLNFVFVQMMKLEAFGLALASSLGMWIFLGVQAEAFVSGKSHFRLSFPKMNWRETGQIFRIGLPGAASNVYQTGRGLIVNWLLESYVGSVGISAFSTANYLLAVFWAVPAGMLAVSRMLISVSVGEEDRQTLTDVMRNMFTRFVPLQCIISLLIILCAVPFTTLFYQDPSQSVFQMTVAGFRILPLCMPLSIICMHFTCYGQTSNKQFLIHTLALLDGIVCVAGFTALLIRPLGMNSIYIANVLNGVVTTIVIVVYAWLKNRHLPRNMEELMVIPADFGAKPEDRMDLSVQDMEAAVTVSRQIQDFCEEHGISKRSSYLAGLSMEELAGNIIDHGFSKDKHSHSVDVRVAKKENDVILRIKDDCVPFDPGERQKLTDNEDISKNIGLRMVFRMAKDIKYQNILGLNVLTIRIPAES